MLKVKKWQRVIDEESGVSCEIGRLRWDQGPELATMLATMLAPVQDLHGDDGKPRPGTSVTEMTAAVRGALAGIDAETLRDLFGHKVRNVEGIETEDGPVTTGPELLEVADQRIIMWVLSQLIIGSSLSDAEGKASGSASTSQPEPTPASASTARRTTTADGLSHSTVTATPTGSGSSSQVA